MVQSPSWKANRFSSSRELPRNLWNLKVHYRIHNSQPPAPVLRQINSVSAPCHFLKVHFNIILPSMLRSFKWSDTLRFLHPKPIYTSPPLTRATCPAHFILRSDHPNIYLCLCILSHGVTETSLRLCWTTIQVPVAITVNVQYLRIHQILEVISIDMWQKSSTIQVKV